MEKIRIDGERIVWLNFKDQSVTKKANNEISRIPKQIIILLIIILRDK